jgi:hypothetical protein
MSAPITEAHRKLACDVLLDHSVSGAATKDGVIAAAQWIADSEAEAVQIAMLREYGNLSATNESLAKECDQLRAELARLDAEKPWLKEANATVAELRADVERLRQDSSVDYAREIRAERDEFRAEVERLKHGTVAQFKDAFIDELTREVSLLIARAERAEAELATERVRLDWLEDHGWVTGEPCDRAGIDAAMKEGAK